MDIHEMEHNEELKKKVFDQIAEYKKEGIEDVEATIKAFKSFDIEFDEDIMRKVAVQRMELDDDFLENVTGGQGRSYRDDWCVSSYSCYVAYNHNAGTGKEACLADHTCMTVYHHDNDGDNQLCISDNVWFVYPCSTVNKEA